MAFKPGNKEQQKADRKKAKIIRQQLVSALNEAHDNGVSKLRAVVDTWIKNAIAGDQGAINAIADRVDGKPQQSIDANITDDRDLRDLSGAELDARIRDVLSRIEGAAGGAGGEAEGEDRSSDLREFH